MRERLLRGLELIFPGSIGRSRSKPENVRFVLGAPTEEFNKLKDEAPVLTEKEKGSLWATLRTLILEKPSGISEEEWKKPRTEKVCALFAEGGKVTSGLVDPSGSDGFGEKDVVLSILCLLHDPINAADPRCGEDGKTVAMTIDNVLIAAHDFLLAVAAKQAKGARVVLLLLDPSTLCRKPRAHVTAASDALIGRTWSALGQLHGASIPSLRFFCFSSFVASHPVAAGRKGAGQMGKEGGVFVEGTDLYTWHPCLWRVADEAKAEAIRAMAARLMPQAPWSRLRRATLAVVAVLEMSPPKMPASAAPFVPPRNLPAR